MFLNKIIMMANIKTGRNGRECDLESERAKSLSRKSRRSKGKKKEETPKPQSHEATKPQLNVLTNNIWHSICIDKRNGDRYLIDGSAQSVPQPKHLVLHNSPERCWYFLGTKANNLVPPRYRTRRTCFYSEHVQYFWGSKKKPVEFT